MRPKTRTPEEEIPEREPGEDIDEPGEDTDETIDVNAGALPREGVPNDVPDTQEALFSDDGAYRVDEDEGAGKRPASVAEVRAETDGLRIVGPDEI